MQGSLQRMTDMYSGDDTCLVIPVYQRNYDWKRENCERLFDDLVAVVRENRENHFFGSIVYKDEGAVGESTIIDGQQRLTTINLLFLALHHVLTNESVDPDPSLANRIASGFLHSEYASSGYKLKLKPVKADASAYEKLFGREENFDETSNVTANFRYFVERLGRGEITPQETFDAIRKLQVMRLKLEGEDNAQLIFESLNSTGVDLTQADMIRNFVLMDLDRATQERLYEDYWNQIEKNVGYETSRSIRHYLTVKLGRVPSMSRIYDEFRDYVKASGEGVLQVLVDMHRYSTYEHQIRTATVGPRDVDRLLSRFALVDREVAMPLLFPVVHDYAEGRMSAHDLFRIVAAVDSYITRRWVCGVATNALNKVFSLVYPEAKRNSQPGDNIVDIMIYSLTNRRGSAAFPTDQEFKDALGTKDFYGISSFQRNYFWESMENGMSNDSRDIAEKLRCGDISIEHVMPQTLTPAWRTALGPEAEEIHKVWLNRLANLTVTGYNSTYSNQPFEKKRDHEQGFANSPYRLNQLIRNADAWGPDQLEARSAALTAQAMAYWPTPQTAYAPPVTAPDAVPMGDDQEFTNRVLTGWEFQGSEHTADSWRQMYVELLRILVDIESADVHRFSQTSVHFRLADGDTAESGWSRIGSDLEVYHSNSTSNKTYVLRELFHSLGWNTEELVFHLQAEKSEEA